MKKLLSFGLLVLIGLSLTACREKVVITLDVDVTSVTIIEGESHQITWETNDLEGIDFSSMDSNVLSVNALGLVNAIAEGTTTVEIRSLTDNTVSVQLVVTVRKLISLTSADESVTLKEQQTHLVVITSNDGIVYSSSNTNIFVVDEEGLITAKEEGEANLIVTSTYDSMYEVIIPITVEKLVLINLAHEELVMVVGDSKLIDVTTNDDLLFSSKNPDIATVDALGNIEALKFGEATILITSVTDEEVVKEITITVFKYTEEIEIGGNNILINGMSDQLTISSSPVGAYTGVTWESNNPDIVTVDAHGVVSGIAVGVATIIAKSTLDDTIVDTYDIEVINVSVVDQSKGTGDTYSYMGVDLVFGERLFADITSAIDNSPVGTLIYIAAGTYNENITIDEQGSSLVGVTNAIIIGDIVITANDVTIDNLIFQGNSRIVTTDVSNFVFANNVVENITTIATAFINLNGSTGATISNNTFDTLSTMAISVNDFIGGQFLIEKNIITHATIG
ncbi:MAG: Ig-like domain-containing protein, partial [Candidatus Izimaplasma sp.]|nr:Ig-like domain-containing protein [Candidatus Izimaplasma bacterium]